MTNATTAQERVDWIDAARGLAIVLVVCYHGALIADAGGFALPIWKQANSAGQLLRMPLFFFVSGVLAANAIHRPWRKVAQPRILLFLWLFVLWTAIETVVYTLIPNVRPRPEPRLMDLVTLFLIPDSSIWYLYALALFFVLAKSTKAVSSWVVMGGASMISLAASTALVPVRWVWEDMALYAVFFLAGSRFPQATFSFAARRISFAQVVCLSLLTLVGIATAAWLEAFAVPGIRLALNVLAVIAGISLSVWLSTIGWTWPLCALGKITLPIYVLHLMIMNSLARAMLHILPDPVPTVISAVAPAVLILIGLAFSVTLVKPLGRIPGVLTLPPVPSPARLKMRDTPQRHHARRHSGE